MSLLHSVAQHCGVLVGPDRVGAFRHWATAWTLGGGEWVTAWGEEPPPAEVRLLIADGRIGELAAWERGDDGIAGFRSLDTGEGLPTVPEGVVPAKRDPLAAIGYADLIDHPSLLLHRGSLTAERYVPYLCPWAIQGHLALYGAQVAWIAGRFYAGMAGAPVLDRDLRVAGVLLGGDGSPEHPPLARFRRLA